MYVHPSDMYFSREVCVSVCFRKQGLFTNKCFDRRIVVWLIVLLGNYDRQSKQQTIPPADQPKKILLLKIFIEQPYKTLDHTLLPTASLIPSKQREKQISLLGVWLGKMLNTLRLYRLNVEHAVCLIGNKMVHAAYLISQNIDHSRISVVLFDNKLRR